MKGRATEESMRDSSILPNAMRDAFRAMQQSFVPYALPFLGFAILSSGLLKANDLLLGRKSLFSFGVIFCFCIVLNEYFEAAVSALYMRETNEGRRVTLGEFRTALSRSGLTRTIVQLLWRDLLWSLLAVMIAMVVALAILIGLALIHPHTHVSKAPHPWRAKVWAVTLFMLAEALCSRYWFVLPMFMQSGGKAGLFRKAVQDAKPFRLPFCFLAASFVLIAAAPYQILRPWLTSLIGPNPAAFTARVVSIAIGALVSSWSTLFRTACYVRTTQQVSISTEQQLE